MKTIKIYFNKIIHMKFADSNHPELELICEMNESQLHDLFITIWNEVGDSQLEKWFDREDYDLISRK
ncbi:MAG: hypothetical protein ACFFHD_15290 [Promethearchaeota archaeon]